MEVDNVLLVEHSILKGRDVHFYVCWKGSNRGDEEQLADICRCVVPIVLFGGSVDEPTTSNNSRKLIQVVSVYNL